MGLIIGRKFILRNPLWNVLFLLRRRRKIGKKKSLVSKHIYKIIFDVRVKIDSVKSFSKVDAKRCDQEY